MRQQKLTRSEQLRIESITGSAETIASKIKQVKADRVRTLVVRDAMLTSPDGYATSTRLSGMPTGGSDGSSTESAVVARSHIPRHDELRATVAGLENDLREAERLVSRAVSRLEYVAEVEDETKERSVSAPCAICEASAQKSGWCLPHYDEWRRHGRPDRHLWNMFRREDRTDDGQLRVPQCPRPTGPVFEGPWVP